MKTQEELLYLLRYLDSIIENFVYDVVYDSDEQPEFSAVTASNLIKCFITVMKELDVDCNYTDIKSYFEVSHISEDKYAVFENKREKESKYYIGKQY